MIGLTKVLCPRTVLGKQMCLDNKFYIIYFLKRVISEQLIVFIYNQQTELMDFSLDVPVSVLDRIQDTFFIGHSWGVPYL